MKILLKKIYMEKTNYNSRKIWPSMDPRRRADCCNFDVFWSKWWLQSWSTWGKNPRATICHRTSLNKNVISTKTCVEREASTQKLAIIKTINWTIIWHHAQHINRDEEEGDTCIDGVCLSKQLSHMMGPWSPGVCLPTHGKQRINSLFCFSSMQFFLSLLNYLPLYPWVFYLLPFLFSPPFRVKGGVVTCVGSFDSWG